jgi:hypothetical protein
MSKKIKIGTITVNQQLVAQRKARREEDIQDNLNICHKRVHDSKKTYKRNNKHKGREI